MMTMLDVAKKAGVSKATVSRYLNNRSVVQDATAEKIKQAIEELDYVPNKIARTLYTKESLNIAMLVNDIANPITAAYVKGAEAFTSEQNYNFILCNTGFELEKEAAYISNLQQKQIDGVLIAPCGNGKDHIISLMNNGIPCVFITRRIIGIDADYARFDHVDGSYRVTSHILALKHRRIGAIGRKGHDDAYKDRLQGYALAMEEYGVDLDSNLVILGGVDSEAGYTGMKCFMNLTDPPTAIYTATIMQAIGVIQYCRDKNLAIPEDISLASFESAMDFEAVIEPSLTSYVLPAYELGSLAAKMLFERIEGLRGNPREVGLLGYLKIGGSTASPFRKADEEFFVSK